MKSLILSGISEEGFKYLLKSCITEALQDMSWKKEEKEILSVDEAAEMLHLAKQTLYGLTSKREIPFIKRPGSKKLTFRRSDLEAWLDNGRRKTRIELMEQARQEPFGPSKKWKP